LRIGEPTRELARTHHQRSEHPIIKGTRISVGFVIDLLGRGWTMEQILREHDHLKAEDLQACLAYAADLLRTERDIATTEDPIVAEIRKARHEHAEKFNNDIAAICADYRRMAKESGRQYVSFPPRRIETKAEPVTRSENGDPKDCAG
jgi:uncharacterized protein (DUF433 family)